MGAISKILTTGFGAALMTESGIRSAISDIQLTKQARGYLARGAIKGKEEVTRMIAGEISRFFQHIKLHEEIKKALSGLTIELEARIRIAGPQGSLRTRLSGIKFRKERSKKD